MSAKLQAAEDFLRQRLGEAPQTVESLIAEAPASRRTLFRAARQVGVVRLPKAGGSKVTYWALPDRLSRALANVNSLVRRGGLPLRKAVANLAFAGNWDDALLQQVAAALKAD